MKTSITPGNFIRRRISLMLNMLPDCDEPTEDDLLINTLFIQVRGRKQETVRLSAQVHHRLSEKMRLCSTSFLLMAEGWELVPGLDAEDPCETARLPPMLGQTNSRRGVHIHLF